MSRFANRELFDNYKIQQFRTIELKLLKVKLDERKLGLDLGLAPKGLHNLLQRHQKLLLVGPTLVVDADN